MTTPANNHFRRMNQNPVETLPQPSSAPPHPQDRRIELAPVHDPRMTDGRVGPYANQARTPAALNASASDWTVQPELPPFMLVDDQEDESTADHLNPDNIRPWIRFWARMIDNFLGALLVGAVAGIIAPSALALPDPVFGLIVLICWVFIEAALLASWGTTPGKSLLRITVRDSDGEPLTFAAALARSYRVLVHGLGFGILIFQIFALLKSYNRLTRHGATGWDEKGSVIVEHDKVGWLRGIVVTALILGIVLILVLVSVAGEPAPATVHEIYMI